MPFDFKPFNLKTVLPVLVLLAATGAAWGIVVWRPDAAAIPSEPSPPSVEIIRAEARTLSLNVASQGVVSPREQIDLVSEVHGKVVQVHPSLAVGGFFTADEVLLSIDPREYDYAIVSALARVAETKRELAFEQAQVEQAQNEWQALGEGKASELALHKPQLAEAEAKLRATLADLAKARLDRSRCEIRAPFAGRVLSKQVGLGQYIPPGTVIARIFASDVAEIRLPIGIDQLAFLDLPLGRETATSDQWPKVTLSAEIAGKRHFWQGRIVRTEASLDADSGQLYLVAAVERPFQTPGRRPPLLIGLFVQAEIEGVPRDGLFELPRTAVNSLQLVKLVDKEQRLELRRVELLRTEADRVIVQSGLKSGDRVILSELPVPVAGMKIAIAGDKTTSVP